MDRIGTYGTHIGQLGGHRPLGSSDHAAFASKRIPFSFFVTTDISTLHPVDDTPPESLDIESMGLAVNYITGYVYTLLTSDQLPEPQENS